MTAPEERLAAPASRHRRPGLARPAVFGGYDGLASLLGVIAYLLIRHPAWIFPAALSGAISSAISMGAGEYLSDSESGFAASGVMALATFAGALAPAVPFAVASGPVAVAESAVICVCCGITVAAMRPSRGFGLALAETFGTLAVVLAAVILLGLVLPGGTG